MSFALLPHTADLRAEIRAGSVGELYQSAVDLVRHILVGDSAVSEAERLTLDLGKDAEAERFFRFVRELVYLFDAEDFLAARVTLGEDEARLSGESFDSTRHQSQRQLKAVTRHGFRFASAGRDLRAELVFDL